MLDEWYRVLCYNGILRIAVPDFFQLTSLYLHGNIKIEQALGPLYGKMLMNDTTIYHKTVYDILSLTKLLKRTGFKKIYKYDWKNTEHSQFDDHSQAYIPNMDKENGTLISLNMEAIK